MEIFLSQKSLKYLIIVLMLISLMLGGCNPNVILQSAIMTSDAGSHQTLSSTNTPVLPSETTTPTYTHLPPTITQSPTLTFTPTITETVTPTFTATWAFNPAGKVVAPILLYHHVSDENQGNRYYISTATFDEQMKLLHDWGYTAIPISTLVTALVSGGPLPQRPVVLTFDDGNEDIYQNAFPIMKKYGFCGTFYIIENYLNAKDFVSTDQLNEMIKAGWELGSHTKSHSDLTSRGINLTLEITDSRLDFQKLFNVPINTIAYPFGTINRAIADKVANSGYSAALGLGTSTTHTMANLFYLDREEVQEAYSMDQFKALLPWQGLPSDGH